MESDRLSVKRMNRFPHGAAEMTLTAAERQTLASGGSVHVVIEGIACVIVRADVFEESCVDGSDELNANELRGIALQTMDDSDSAEAIKPRFAAMSS